MNYNESLLYEIRELDKKYKSEHIDINCTVITSDYAIFGQIDFEANGVNPEDGIIIKNARLSKGLFDTDVLSFNKTLIRYEDIKSFSYSVKS